VIQQVEGNLITPIVHQRAVDLPPALTMFAILAFGVLFGPLGILLATPLAVVGYVLVNRLWIEEVLEEPVDLPGEDDASGEGPDGPPAGAECPLRARRAAHLTVPWPAGIFRRRP
jgi:hypothetical protein